MHHDLKIWPQHFAQVENGTKTFEIRNNDRAFQKGDTVTLKEFYPKAPTGGEYYTGYQLTFGVGAVYPIDIERVVFSLLPTNKKKEG